MVTLKELVNDQAWSGATDTQIIKEYFRSNDLEEDGIDIISDLMKSKINKLKCKYELVETWSCALPSKYLYENYDLDTADHLHILELNYLVNGCTLSEKQLKWARENVPNIERPEAYFRPLINWLKKEGIEFKDRKIKTIGKRKTDG